MIGSNERLVSQPRVSHDLELNELMTDKKWSDLQIAKELRTRSHPDYNYSNTNYNSSCMKTTHLRPVPLGVLMTQHLGFNICTHAVPLIVHSSFVYLSLLLRVALL